MADSQVPAWSSSGGYLYKFRQLGLRASEIVQTPHLYFAPIRDMNDRTEVGAELVIQGGQEAVLRHLQEYLSVLQERRQFELQLYGRAMVNLAEDMLASVRAKRRAQRLKVFDARLKYANDLIASLQGLTDQEAATTLQLFYESIRQGIRDAAVCCVARTPASPKLWEEYADNHRGVCFQFNGRIFSDNKKIEKSEVVYTPDGRLHPLETGYLNAYQSLYSTKHISYSHEDEVRFFLYGDPRPVPTKSADLVAIILGSEALTPIPNAQLEDVRRGNIRDLCSALERRNAARNPEHRTEIYVASWSGFRLHVRRESASKVLGEHT